MTKHCILFGFKHVGKSVIGKALAEKLQRPFIDLDQAIEDSFNQKTLAPFNCRQIMQQQGETFFRILEQTALSTALLSASAVIALGGGTLMSEHCQQLVKNQRLIHITAPRTHVFERIIHSGLPAFLNTQCSPLDAFNQLWATREKIYRSLSHDCVLNDTDIDTAVTNILTQLKNSP